MPGIFCHKLGKTKTNPNKIKIPPERYVHTAGGIMISAVEALRRNVKTIIESPSEATTMYGVARLRPEADEPTTTGSSGKMHGARTVSIPARNEIPRRAMLLDVAQEGRKVWRSGPLVYLRS